MEYNTGRSNMIIPEYGRNIHKMIKHAMTIADRDERNQSSWSIIRVMGDLNPHLRDVPDFQHKLWDQLFIMSDFLLDVDSPFQKPEPEQFQIPPKRMKYPERLREFRYYGKIVKDMIKVAIDCSEEDKKEGLIYAIANTMKKSYLKWNKETVEDSVIIEDLKKLSGDKLYLHAHGDSLINAENILNSNKKKNQSFYSNNNKKKRFNNGNGNI
ncbi:MAG: DUF4290 domain-containing protein [Flavobacteriales bacterium Tduv]